MSSITLTDRITVSVRAKNETQGNSQKRDTGRNIAKALGNDSISDSLADQLGNTKNPTITDENGNEWVSMEDIIAAGRKMKENGAFDNDSWDKYEGANYCFYTMSSLEVHTYDIGSEYDSDFKQYNIYTGNFYAYKYNGTLQITSVSGESDILRSYYYHGELRSETYADSVPAINVSDIPDRCRPVIDFNGQTTSIETIRQVEALGVNPTEHHAGGSLVDWDAPNAEVERQIKNLHETWDVTEHEGAVTANGTYVMAGPIEFNPGD